MKKMLQKLGFTLMEVNLAIFIMAAGVLAMVSLYPLGYRENEQSKDDVKSAAAADAVLNQLTAALSSRNITWSQWKSAVESAVQKTGSSTGTGAWMAYCTQHNNSYAPKKRTQMNSLARQVFTALAGAYHDSGSPQWPVNSDLACALVAQWGRKAVYDGSKVRQQEDHSRVAISFRCSHNAGSIFASPIYYTEVHFQGDQKDIQ